MSIVVRDFDPERDRPALRACFIELQAVERGLEPHYLAEPELAADPYLDILVDLWRAGGTQIRVAELQGEVVGFVTVVTEVGEQSPDDAPIPFAILQDIVVLPVARGARVGERLVHEAERIARAAGAAELHITMLARNDAARRFYERSGYRDVLVEMRKAL